MIRIGKIAATHGLQGALILTHIVGNARWLKKEEPLFLEMQKGSFIPFFISASKAANDEEYVVNLEETTTVEAARKLVGKHVYVNETVLSKYAANSPLLWIGFKVNDANKGELGVVDDMMHTSTQWIARMIINGKEVLLPLVNETIESIDLKKKTLYLDLPEGLLEVYL